jgi:hypothetical protein
MLALRSVMEDEAEMAERRWSVSCSGGGDGNGGLSMNIIAGPDQTTSILCTSHIGPSLSASNCALVVFGINILRSSTR